MRSCSQFLTYLDRSSLAFAAPQMLTDLRLDGATYGLGAGLLFVTYSVLMLPGSLLVERLGAPNGLALATIAWGLVTALTSLVRDAPSFFAARLALGAAEACCFPGALTLVTLDAETTGSYSYGGIAACIPALPNFCKQGAGLRLFCRQCSWPVLVPEASCVRRYLGAPHAFLHRGRDDAGLQRRRGRHPTEPGAFLLHKCLLRLMKPG